MPPDLSNKFHWATYKVPRVPCSSISSRANENKSKSHANDDDDIICEQENFTIRSLKQGGTGAYKTWPTAEFLLDYLVRNGNGLNKVVSSSSRCCANVSGVLDLRDALKFDQANSYDENEDDTKILNVVELGGGTGFLSVGLALSLNRESCHRQNYNINNSNSSSCSSSFHPKIRLLCTDMDKGTIKNMRYNVMQQPRDKQVAKAVRVETLNWGPDVGGDAFSKAVQAHFAPSSPSKSILDDTNSQQHHRQQQQAKEDPIRLVTHLIGSDVHYGQATLEPLSSVISSVKLRNPNVCVILAVKERSPNAMENLKQRIEEKVKCAVAAARLDNDNNNKNNDNNHHTDLLGQLEGFSVTVRDVLHNYGDDLSNLKLIGC